MRSIICRFESVEEFFAHLSPTRDLAFVAKCDMTLGQTATITVMVSSLRERVQLDVNVVERTAVAMDYVGEESTRYWSYRVRPCDHDAVWLNAFVSKLKTMTSVSRVAA